MNRRILLIVVFIAVIVIGVGLFLSTRPRTTPNPNTTPGATQVVSGQPEATLPPTNTPLPMVDIIVAVQPINRGQIITPDMVDYRSWPEQSAPLSAITDMESVVGKIARTDIYRESPITNVVITENLNDLGAVGSDAAAVLPAGTRMISVPIDRITSGAYAIQPGDRVDAIISLLYVDVDEDFQSILPNDLYMFVLSGGEEAALTLFGPFDGRFESQPIAGQTASILVAPHEDVRPRLTTQMTIQNALVVYVGDFPENGRMFGASEPTPVPLPTDVEPVEEEPVADGTPRATAAPTRPDIISLAVSPQEAVTMTYFVEAKIPVTFALRPANETGTQSTQQVTLDYIMSSYAIQLPARRPFSIEPAIRSIRQLIAGETIELRPSIEPTAVPEEE